MHIVNSVRFLRSCRSSVCSLSWGQDTEQSHHSMSQRLKVSRQLYRTLLCFFYDVVITRRRFNWLSQGLLGSRLGSVRSNGSSSKPLPLTPAICIDDDQLFDDTDVYCHRFLPATYLTFMEHLYTTSVSVCFDELRVNVSKNIGGQISYTPIYQAGLFVSRSREPGNEASKSPRICRLSLVPRSLQPAWE